MTIKDLLPIYEWHPDGVVSRQEASLLAQNRSLPLLFASHLLSRGFSEIERPEELEYFLNPSLAHLWHPCKIPEVACAVEKILKAVEAGKSILIFGDFDVDGISATVILEKTLRVLGADVSHFIPERSEGYGLSEQAVSRCLAGGTPDLLITVDCGINATESISRFLDIGAEVIVTDHHVPVQTLPEACIEVCTHSVGIPQDCRNLCGAGLAYKIACGLIVTKYPAPDRCGRALLHSMIDILAVATVADLVPLTGENRVYVREGLALLNRSPGVGLRALLNAVFAIPPTRITVQHLAFVLAPAVNSAGRMESAEPALEMLIDDDADSAREKAVYLKRMNAERREKEREILSQAKEQLDSGETFDLTNDAAIVVAGHNWHTGIIGIVAARLVDEYRRPVAVISIDPEGRARGSSRAPAGSCLIEALKSCGDCLEKFGGHDTAAGFSILEENIPQFRHLFVEASRAESGGEGLRNILQISGEIGVDDISPELLSAIELLEPCGNGNPSPIWKISNVTLKQNLVGKTQEHISLLLERGDGLKLPAIWFNGAKYAGELAMRSRWDIVGELKENRFMGDAVIQLQVHDAAPARE